MCLLLNVVHAELQTNRPNVIIVNVDNHDKGSLACYGNKFIETPNIDKLFHGGIRFENYVTAGRCTSSRAALLTGRYHARTSALGTAYAWEDMASGIPTIAEYMRDGGYQTAMFGKWHIGLNAPLRPEDRGFDEVVCVENGMFLNRHEAVPGYNSTGRTGLGYYFRQNGEWRLFKGFRTDIWFDQLVDYIGKNKANSKPFFVYLATVTSHAPTFGPKDLRAKYQKKYNEDRYAELRARFEKQQQKKGNGGEVVHPYDHAADIENLDRNIGRVLSTLKANDMLDNTIMIYMSDGAGRGAAGYQVSGPFAGTSKVCPMVVYAPKLFPAPAKPIHQLLANLDVLPTILEIADITVENPGYDGQSFYGLMAPGRGTAWKDRTYVSDHQSASKAFGSQVFLQRLGLTTVFLPDGRSVTWSNGKHRKGLSEKDVADATEAYEKWLKHILSDFQPYAFRYIGSPSNNPVFIEKSYPISGGPAGPALQSYYGLEVVQYGSYEISTSTHDNPAYPRKESGKAAAGQTVTLVCARQIKPGRIPVHLDEKLNVYRVLPETFADYFEVKRYKGKTPVQLELKKGRYLMCFPSDGFRKGPNIRIEKLR